MASSILINKIVAVLNDLKEVDTILEKALIFSQEQNAILELLYIHEEALFALPDYFSPKGSQEKDTVDEEKVKQHLQEKLLALGSTQVPIFIKVGDTLDRVLHLTKDDKKTLIVTMFHPSLTQNLVHKSKHSLLVVKNSTKHYANIIIPVDLGKNSSTTIEWAKGVFLQSKLQLLYEHRYLTNPSIVDADYLGIPVNNISDLSMDEAVEKSQKTIFEALKVSTGLSGKFIEQYSTIEDDISTYVAKHHFDLTLLSMSKEHFLFSDSITYALLETLSTDILIYKTTGQ